MNDALKDVLSKLDFKPFTMYEDEINAGDVLKTIDGELLLVGDTNERGGTCSCCTDWRWSSDIIARARIYE